jgi:hypothetical protein
MRGTPDRNLTRAEAEAYGAAAPHSGEEEIGTVRSQLRAILAGLASPPPAWICFRSDF